MKNHSLLAMVAIAMLFVLSGCATIFSETEQEILFESQPSGAKVYIDGVDQGVTPIKIIIPRNTFKKTYVRFQKDGYVGIEKSLKKSLNKVALLNTIMWPSWATDAYTGAMTEYSPTSYFADLVPKNKVASESQLQQRQIHQFLVSNHLAITEELAKGEGEYISSMIILLGVESSHEALLVSSLQNQLMFLGATNSSQEFIDIIYHAVAELPTS